MSALAPILDWLEENSPRFEPVVPVDRKLRVMLADRGLHPPLIDLVAHGSQAPAAFPGCSRGDQHTLNGPGRIERTERGWDLGGWVAHPAGRLHQKLADGLGPARSIRSVLDSHLADLQAGKLTWHASTGCFVDLRARPDLVWIDRIQAKDPRAMVANFTALVRRELRRGAFGLGEVGTLAVSTRQPFDRPHHRTGRLIRVPAEKIPTFRQGGPVPRHRGAAPPALLKALSKELDGLEPGVGAAGLPGLGQFSVTVRPSPGKRLTQFECWALLKDALNR